MVNEGAKEESAVLRIGIVGWGWMGQVHARAYARMHQHYPDAPLRPNLVAVADNAPDDRLTTAVNAFGFQDAHSDWRDLLARDDIDAVSVTGPNFIHREVAVAAAEAGSICGSRSRPAVARLRLERFAMPCAPAESNLPPVSTIATYRH
jgi:Oxidoreductase family, NAD-binding Rossmann fold